LFDASTVDLSIIIPAYNETERLPIMLDSAMDYLTSIPRKKRVRTYEIIIVDDGSTDKTADASVKLATNYPGSDIRVVTLVKNLGKGGAVRHGMLHGRGRRLLMVDADGASRFNDLDLLWDAMDAKADRNPAVIAIGSRAHLVKTEVVVKVRA
jgi:dolichyl-phosphate beta-glucosyltransferase